MKLVLQRVSKATVFINNQLYSKIQKGILVLIGIEDNDAESELDYYVNKDCENQYSEAIRAGRLKFWQNGVRMRTPFCQSFRVLALVVF